MSCGKMQNVVDGPLSGAPRSVVRLLLERDQLRLAVQRSQLETDALRILFSVPEDASVSETLMRRIRQVEEVQRNAEYIR